LSSLLARFAENSFWMARYLERVENLARILDVNETFARDSHGAQDWLPILRLHSDEERFFDLHNEADAESVVHFYVLDRRNPNAIVNAIFLARENARTLRHLLSLEIWLQLNIMWNWISGLDNRDLNLADFSRLCARIKEGCQLHSGLAEHTMYRDQVWLFYQLGCFIERCDQTTRLVDIKYHALLPRLQDVGTPIDVSQWNVLLRSAAAYHGYRRVFPRQMTPTTVSGFILFDPYLPRSVAFCVREMRRIIGDFQSHAELRHVVLPTDTVSRLEELASRQPWQVIAGGLHEFLDQVQIELIALTRQIGLTFFGHPAEVGEPLAVLVPGGTAA